MGEVYLAEQQSIGTRVAIKVLQPQISEDTDQVQRFFNEARAVSRIQHAGIVKIFDVGFHGSGQAYLIMEHLEGESLASRIKRTHLPVAHVADIGRQIASVLEATHAAGITHRDLKPDNIYLVPDRERGYETGRVKILDFGVAKLSGTLAGASPQTVGTLGTPAYMAPEQWGDSSKVDWRADLYALGCVTFEMLCGQTPFVATSWAEACAKHLTEVPPRAKSFDDSIPDELDALLVRLLAKSPADRPASMHEVAAAFEAIRNAAPAGAPRPVVDRAALAGTPTISTTAGASFAERPQATIDQPTIKREPRPRRTFPVAIVAALVTAAAAVAVVKLVNFGATKVERPPDALIIATVPADASIDAVIVDASVDAAVTPTRDEAKRASDTPPTKQSSEAKYQQTIARLLQRHRDEFAHCKPDGAPLKTTIQLTVKANGSLKDMSFSNLSPAAQSCMAIAMTKVDGYIPIPPRDMTPVTVQFTLR